MKDEECGQEKFYLIEKIITELHAMQNQIRDREKIKSDLEKEISHRICIEEEFQTIRTSLEEQLAESETKLNKITEELQREVEERHRIEEEFQTIRRSLEEQLAETEAERDRFTAERKREVEEWKQALDNVRDRLINAKL